MSRITVRQTTDPYVDDIQYIAWNEVPLEPNGGLRMSTIGLGQPGDNFFIMWHKQLPNCQLPSVCLYAAPSRILSAYHIQMMTTFEDGPYPILTLVERGDHDTADENYYHRRDARELQQQIAYLKGLVTGGWNWAASALPAQPVISMASRHLDADPIIPKGLQPDSVSTSVLGVPNTSRLVHRRRTAQVGHQREMSF